MKEIDVIIPAYNARGWLKNILEDLDKQTIKEKIVVTIIDDGSNKDYKEYINELKLKLDIRIIRNKVNMGISKTRNKGIKLTKLPYIVFFDADDRLGGKDTLEKLFKYREYDLVYGLELKNKEEVKRPYHIYAKLFKRYIIEKYNIKCHKYNMEEDGSFMMLYYSVINEKRVKFINEVLYKYEEVNNNSLTKNNKIFEKYDVKPIFYAIDRTYKFCKKINNYTFFKDNCYVLFVSLSKVYFDNEKKGCEIVKRRFIKYMSKFYKKYKLYIENYIKFNKTYKDDLDYYYRFLNIIKLNI